MQMNTTQPTNSNNSNMRLQKSKSKERNASLLNASALSRETGIVHPFNKSVEPAQNSSRTTGLDKSGIAVRSGGA